MGIGASIFLIAIGAILTFALDIELSGLNLDVVGIILMLVGMVGLLMTLFVWAPRRRATRVIEERPVVGTDYVDRRSVPQHRVVEERQVYGDSGDLDVR
jgi:hypothetical protein